ncbi:MAG: DNA-binding PadR family transcriptional regulator [Halioglobus sp.]
MAPKAAKTFKIEVKGFAGNYCQEYAVADGYGLIINNHCLGVSRIQMKEGGDGMALAQAIMTALIDDDLSGYELAKDFESSLGFFWRASHQQIYQELHKLSDKQWLNKREVSQSGRPNKIVYGLTKSGRKELASWVYSSSKNQAAKDELLVKLYNLAEENAPHLTTEVIARREEMMRLLYLFEKIRLRHYENPKTLPTRRKGVYLALASGISQGEHFLAWCDEALALLATVKT